jgi:hypothetical protein
MELVDLLPGEHGASPPLVELIPTTSDSNCHSGS